MDGAEGVLEEQSSKEVVAAAEAVAEVDVEVESVERDGPRDGPPQTTSSGAAFDADATPDADASSLAHAQLLLHQLGLLSPASDVLLQALPAGDDLLTQIQMQKLSRRF